jgi:hypothetical protein
MTLDEAYGLAATVAWESASASLADLRANDFLGVGYAITTYGWAGCTQVNQSTFDCTYGWEIVSGVGGALRCLYDITFEKTGPSSFVYRNIRNGRCQQS